MTAGYQKIAEANRQFYAQTAGLYEATENCIHDQSLQTGLEADLDRILALLGTAPQSIRALDACGGSGNISLKLLQRGVAVTQTDISPELQQIFRQKCQASGFHPQIICSEIGNYLANESQTFHLITFSSALHHLENIEAVLTLAHDRLAPGGLLYTVFDPTLQKSFSRLTRVTLRVEYYLFKFFCQTADFPKAIRRRIRRMLTRVSPNNKLSTTLNNDTIGMLAEYHVGTGIDDLALVTRLQQTGYEVVWHHRYAEARFKLTRRILAWTGDVTTFKLLLRKPASPRN